MANSDQNSRLDKRSFSQLANDIEHVTFNLNLNIKEENY